MTGEQRRFKVQHKGVVHRIPFERFRNFTTKAKAQATVKALRAKGRSARLTKERYPKHLGIAGRQTYWAVWVF